MAYQHFKLRQRQFDAAHDLLKRSLQSLAKHKHVLVTLRFAQEEFDIGSQERGRTLFEGLLANYPKRTDLWIVYVDQESKHGNYDRARRLYERMTTAKMSSRAMRNIFKKFLRFEMQHGNDETVEHVKAKARDYVQAMS
jgi:rRNA biogenesis protein RRP5